MGRKYSVRPREGSRFLGGGPEPTAQFRFVSAADTVRRARPDAGADVARADAQPHLLGTLRFGAALSRKIESQSEVRRRFLNEVLSCLRNHASRVAEDIGASVTISTSAALSVPSTTLAPAVTPKPA